MSRTVFEWDDANVEHIARHGVEPDEAEAVLDNSPLVLRTEDQRRLAYGRTDEGRGLLVVFARKPGPAIRVITARELTDNERHRLRRRQKHHG